MSTGASFKRGKSKQDYATPREFIAAVERRFGKIEFDLAADGSNCVVPDFYCEADDSLAQEWHKLKGLLWLNPPFGNIEPWVKKCHEESKMGAMILFLTPASVGSNWFADHVHKVAMVSFLRPRLKFVGAKDPYPKDLMISVFDNCWRGYECWKWK